ncbi:MAG TPA: hypothetical protein VI299_03555 [Polyangiales bacterium]
MRIAPTKTAWLDPHCSARIVSRRSLRYAAPPDPALDRPAHVRAGSGLAWVGSRLAVVQDDANFIALVDPATGQATDIPLPPGPNAQRLFDDTRKTKHLKLDLEACFTVPTADGVRLIAIGSGSKPVRERIVVVDLTADALRVENLRVLDATAFYAQLHQRTEFSGSELNLEGVVLRDQTLLFFQRGNGAPRNELRAINAVGELDWSAFQAYVDSHAAAERVPSLGKVTQYDLGQIADVPFTFTDAALGPDGQILFLASAEDSSDSVTDGVVHGTRIGALTREGDVRMAPLHDEHGAPSRVKAEGIALDLEDPTKAWLVVDMDDPSLAAELLQVELTFPARRLHAPS